MSNEKVSQMPALSAAELAVDDVLYVIDTSQKQSKKIATSDLLFYIESTGSFNAINSINANTASYVIGSNVIGTVQSASYASISSTAISASFVTSVISASYASTASVMSVITANTASFATNTATASFLANTSSFANLSRSASYIIFIPGINNGTASFALSSSQASTASFIVSSSHANFTDTASVSITSSYAATASYVQYSYNGILSYGSALSNKTQFGSGASMNFPVDVNNLSASLMVHSTASKFLVNITIQGGSINGSSGATGGALWRSSSVNDTSLLKCINGIFTSEAGILDDLYSISATYIDAPGLTPGTQVIYRGRVFNNLGNYYVNTSGAGDYLGTSSLTVLEFIA